MGIANAIGLQLRCLNKHGQFLTSLILMGTILLSLLVACQPAGTFSIPPTAPLSITPTPSDQLSHEKTEMASITRDQIENVIRTGPKISLNGQNLQGLNLSGLNLSGFDFSYANLDEVDFSQADLSQAFLWSVSARKANFSQADLSDATLGTANLSEANLRGAVLKRASLLGTNLDRANLSGADLRDADVRNMILTGAIYDAETRWPTGLLP